MTDETEMTAEQRAEAYEVEAASLIDRSIHRLPEGIGNGASLKLVQLIVQAAVERMRASAPTPCPETWQPAPGGDVGHCILNAGHAGKCQMRSRHGVAYVVPGEIDNEPNPETRRDA
jgi:hypothetical protein